MRVFLFFIAACLTLSLSAQQVDHYCGHDEVIRIQAENHKSYDLEIRKLNSKIKAYIDAQSNKGGAKKSQPATYIIPVVFHIVHGVSETYGNGANISYARILSQMNALNAAFAKDYANYNGQGHASYAQNTNIQFCLAKTTMPSTVSFYNGPQGVEHGVVRYGNALTQHVLTNTGASALLGLTHPTTGHFPFQNYLNIWVVSSIGTGSGSGGGTIMAYAPTPLMNSFPLDGVVTRADIVGDNSAGNSFPLGFGLHQGKVLSHEIGHYMNLYHIFQGGCAGMNAKNSSSDACDLNGDFICDTDPSLTQNYNCNLAIPNTCAANYATGTTASDMIENYMSYADDDCQNTFTNDQVQRMSATLNMLRFNLWQTSNLSATGIIGTGSCISPFLMSDIKVHSGNICSGVAFKVSNPLGGNSATSRSWTFPGGTPATASTASLMVTYPTPGSYWAKLSVTSGTQTLKDSVLIHVVNCALDSNKLERAHWFFGDYSEINFGGSGGATVGNSALTHSTIEDGWEATCSMSDKNGNLLFYTNCVDFWDGHHQKINTQSPFFNATGSSSSPGVLAFPFPKDSSKYIIVSSPHTGQNYDSIYYVVYDTLLHTLTPKRGFRHALLPAKYSEPLTAVPHCNGRDYWIVCRPYAQFNLAKAYSILVTPAGPGNIDTVMVSNGIIDQWSGQLKSNSKGTRLAQAAYSGGGKNAYLYNFDKATGLLSNQVPVNVTGPSLATGAIFSPNDSILYTITITSNIDQIWKTNLQTMVTTSITTPSSLKTLQMELGPDNNIYMAQGNYNANATDRLINCNSLTNVTYMPAVLNYGQGQNPYGGLCNFVDARKGAEVAPVIQKISTACKAYQFSVDNCWQVYRAAWKFGDGGTGAGSTVSHTYATAGIYTVTLQLSVGNYSLAPVTQTVQVLSPAASIAGPTVVCKGSTFLNAYNTTNISGATYAWSTTNGTIVTPANQPNISLASNGTGTLLLSLSISLDGCQATASKIITIDAVPAVSLTNISDMCWYTSRTLQGSPAGGVFSGPYLNGAVFTPTASGVFTLTYSYANLNGCSNNASVTISVLKCVDVKELANGYGSASIFPNPGSGLFQLNSFDQRSTSAVQVFNAIGEEVRNFSFVATTELDLRQFTEGLYYVRISVGDRVEVITVMKRQ